MTNKKTLSNLFIILLISIIVAVATFSATLWYSQQNTSTPNIDSWITKVFQSEPEATAQPAFHPLDKVVVSVKGERQTHYVMIELAVQTHYPERIKQIDSYMPLVRNALLKMFSKKKYEELQNQQSIDQLQQEVKQTLTAAFANTTIARDIDDVLFTKYVIQ
ncbi:flagellar protein [Photobacterium angustum]|uniref:Flagellar protein FliL n=1 Tax=Photobacterium angustum TaxID=661 RepID=A0A855SFE8_PHOAN|nr:flagellar basal body-associated FliL family protein [Photobacterium angustum]KJG31569.1 flagellar protein [Photobacterium angustum]KJG38588.1 flagellar protein [Photobacterium angustum]KJG42623.1 flagellar protein [Photobacterium angustum]KJG49924.1 flagellar protein [Photobacterium angustum]KJG53985.1 flagellar protein [Photobacterium angustum]